jgi:hypothetical protein
MLTNYFGRTSIYLERHIFWDDDGTNGIVDKWWTHFGKERARWIALDMAIKLETNITNALKFPKSFSALLHTPSGKCFIA